MIVNKFLLILLAATLCQVRSEFKCDFLSVTNRPIQFIRDPHDCQVFHICAFNKQFTHRCLDGYFFDTLISACNPEHQVDCFNAKTKESYIKNDVKNEIVVDNDVYESSLISEPIVVEDSEPKVEVPSVTTPNLEWLGPNECIIGFSHRIPHQENCGKYYECLPTGEKIEFSCTYPLQFDEYFYECRDYNLVECGKRAEAKDMCDYKPNRPSVHSIPCSLYPSCKGLQDGLYPDMIRDCRHYYQCKDERTLLTNFCPQNSKFNAHTQKCDSLPRVPYACGGFSLNVDLKTSELKCPEENEDTLVRRLFSNPSNCSVFYSCDKNGKISSMECPNGFYFSGKHQKCVDSMEKSDC